ENLDIADVGQALQLVDDLQIATVRQRGRDVAAALQRDSLLEYGDDGRVMSIEVIPEAVDGLVELRYLDPARASDRGGIRRRRRERRQPADAGVAAVNDDRVDYRSTSTPAVRFGEGFRTPARCATVVRGSGPAFESLPRRKPRGGRALCAGRDLWGFEDRGQSAFVAAMAGEA